MNVIRITTLTASIAILGFLSSCIPGLTVPFGWGITDAPIDDPLYIGVYITITDLQVNGESLSEFDGPMTVKLSDLTNGIQQELVDAEVSTGEYDVIAITLDFDQDETGNAPGCYAMTTYERKIDLSNGRGGSETIQLSKKLSITEDEPINLVLDFDLRKSIRTSQPGDESEISFLTGNDLSHAMRVVREEETGTITGQLRNSLFSQEIVNTFNVYAYPRGTFNKSTEQYDQDGDGIPFENAITSTRVQVFPGQNGTFSLHYLEAGDYDVVVEAFEVIEFSAISVGMVREEGAETLLFPVTVTADQSSQVTVDAAALVQ